MSEKMPAATLKALIERLQAATEPDRELDAEIAEYLGHKITWHLGGAIQDANGGPVIHWQKPHPYAGMKEPCPLFTASLDAVMTLVPDDAWLQMSWPQSERAYGYSREEDRIAKATLQFAREPYIAGATHATPSIAICIAALRARSA